MSSQSRVNRRIGWLKHDIMDLSDLLGPDPDRYTDWRQALEDVETKIRLIRERAEANRKEAA